MAVFTGGVIGLWTPGLLPTILREMTNSGPRAGFYVPLRDQIDQMYATYLNDGVVVQNSLPCKIVAALVTGTLGAVLSNPVDVVKVRAMVDPQLYPSTLIAFRAIYEKENWQGFYKGFVPSALRAAFISVGMPCLHTDTMQAL
jgi:hypothetical protein